jgi:hypothetical protein
MVFVVEFGILDCLCHGDVGIDETELNRHYGHAMQAVAIMAGLMMVVIFFFGPVCALIRILAAAGVFGTTIQSATCMHIMHDRRFHGTEAEKTGQGHAQDRYDCQKFHFRIKITKFCVMMFRTGN